MIIIFVTFVKFLCFTTLLTINHKPSNFQHLLALLVHRLLSMANPNLGLSKDLSYESSFLQHINGFSLQN